MSGAAPAREEGQAPGHLRQPVTGAGGRRQHSGSTQRAGHPRSSVASRRDAVLRILLEAYRRDAGPTACDAH